MPKIEVTWTYDKVSNESAEHGDTAEYGFYAHGHEFPIGGCECDEPLSLEDARPDPDIYDSAREAIEDILSTCGVADSVQVNGDKLDFYPADCAHDREYFEDGIETRIMARVKADPRLLRAMARELKS